MIVLRRAGFFGIVLATIWLLGACVNSSVSTEAQSSDLNQSEADSSEIWFKGSVEAAFANSKQTGKPVFLYWGAIWCPPCNELKSQVFSHPGFAELMQPMIPVYLDGDDSSAQIWADRLQAFGYPTILILNADGKEYLRINAAVSFAEFKDVVQSALNQPEDVEALLVRVDQGKVRTEDWPRLAFLDWEQLPASRFPVDRQWRSLKQLVKQRPADLAPALQGSLIAHYIQLSFLHRDQASIRTDLKKVLEQQELHRLLTEILQDSEKSYGARQLLIFRFGTILPWLSATEPRSSQVDAWLRALNQLSDDKRLSVDQKLWSSYPPIEAYRLQQEKADSSQDELPENLVEGIRQAVVEADQAARSKFDRHAVISGAAYLLRQVKLFEDARELLQKEITSTDTPWYYYSSLANLEESVGETAEALRYSQLARETAKGRATRIQWITNDLLLNIRLLETRPPARLAPLIQEFYEVVFYQNDGFIGRNQSRSQRVAEGLKALISASEVKALIENYRLRCQKLEGENRRSCDDHFKSLI